MRGGRIILTVLTASLLGGCSWFQSRWPWEQKQVPVTPPKEQAKLPPTEAPRPTSGARRPPSQPASGPALAAIPFSPGPAASTSRGATSLPGRIEGPVVSASRPATQLASGGLAGPIRLTDLPDQPAQSPPPLRPAGTPAPAPAPTPPSPQPTTRGEVISTLGLQVNNRYITVEDILRSAAGELAELPRGLGESTFRERAGRILQQAVRTQIENAAILPEAESKMADEETRKVEEEMDKTLRALIAEAGGSRKKLEQVWIERGTTLEQVLKEHRNRLIVTRYLQSKIIPDIQITLRMLYDYYQKHKADKYTRNKKVQMQVLAAPLAAFLPGPDPSEAELARAKADARRAIEQANQALRQGRDFTETVKAFAKDSRASSGGIWPPMEAGSYRETQVEEAAFALAEGQVSPIIETPAGFYIVKALKIEGGAVVSFEDAQEEIERFLTEEQYQKLHEKYILAKSPSISSSTRLEEVAMEKAVQRYWKR